jgi:hypothetical protein
MPKNIIVDTLRFDFPDYYKEVYDRALSRRIVFENHVQKLKIFNDNEDKAKALIASLSHEYIKEDSQLAHNIRNGYKNMLLNVYKSNKSNKMRILDE